MGLESPGRGRTASARSPQPPTCRPDIAHPVVVAAGRVELHVCVESACSGDAAVSVVMDEVHDVRQRVLLHSTGDAQLQVGLPRDLLAAGGVGSESVGVRHFAIFSLFN